MMTITLDGNEKEIIQMALQELAENQEQDSETLKDSHDTWLLLERFA